MVEFLAALLNLYALAPGHDRRGQSLVEYALIIVLIAIAVIVAVTALGGQIGTVFSNISASLAGV